jgi:hypothetical protein
MAKEKQQSVAFTVNEYHKRILESRKAIVTDKLITQKEAREYFLFKQDLCGSVSVREIIPSTILNQNRQTFKTH